MPETNSRVAPDCLHKSIISTMALDKHAQRWRILLVGSVLVLLADFGFFLAIPPQTKIFEDILCNQYYASQSVPPFEVDCKITAKSLQCRASWPGSTAGRTPSMHCRVSS